MRRWTKLNPIKVLLFTVALVLGLTLLSPLARAQGSDPRRAQIQSRMRAVENKVLSTAPLLEKVRFIKEIDVEMNTLISEMVEKARQDKEVLKSDLYIYIWDIYDDLIPLLNLKLNQEKTAMTEKSCLEVENSVLVRERGELQDEELEAPSARAERILKMVKTLCGTKGS